MRKAVLLLGILLGLAATASAQRLPRRGTTAPTACTVGDIWIDTDAAAGSNTFVATAISPCVWSLQSGSGSAPGGTTGQTQVRSSAGTFAGVLPLYASQFAGADYCVKTQAAIDASLAIGGRVFVDMSGSQVCTGGFEVKTGTTIDFATASVTVGATVIQRQGTRVRGGGVDPNANGGTLFFGKNGLNAPVWQIDSGTGFVHRAILEWVRLEGNSVNQSGGKTTISAAPTGLVRNAGGTTVTVTTTAAHGYSVGWEVAIINTTRLGSTSERDSFWGVFSIATVPTSTTFTYAQTGTANETSGAGIAFATPVNTDCLYINGQAENSSVRNVTVNDCKFSGVRWVGNISGSSTNESISVFGSFIGGNFHAAFNTPLVTNFKGDDNQVFIRFNSSGGGGGLNPLFKKIQWELVTVGDNDPGIWFDNSSSGGTLEVTGLSPGGGGSAGGRNAVIKVTGGNSGQGINIRSGAAGDGSYLNFLDDIPSSRLITQLEMAVSNNNEFNYFSTNSPTRFNGPVVFMPEPRAINNGINNNLSIGILGNSALYSPTGQTATFGFGGLFGGGLGGASGRPGRMLWLFNDTPQIMQFTDEDTGTTNASSRIRTGTGGTVSIPAGPSIAGLTYLGTPIAITAAPTGVSRTTNVVTITTTSAHRILVGNNVVVAGATGCATSPNGTFSVASVPTSTTFTYAQTAANETCGGGSSTYSRWYLNSIWPPSAAGTASLDFTALAANSCEVLTITVTGAADGDVVSLGVPTALADVDGATERTVFFGWVSATDTVSVRRCNVTAVATADPAAATVRAKVAKF